MAIVGGEAQAQQWIGPERRASPLRLAPSTTTVAVQIDRGGSALRFVGYPTGPADHV